MAWRVMGAVAGVVGVVGVRQLAVWPMGRAAVTDAAIRLSFSARPQRVETCRTLTDAELAARPAHMRLRTECTGGFATYRLTARLDGREIVLDTLRGGGIRHDRPIHVFREVPVAPGARRFQLVVERLGRAADSASVAGGGAERERVDTLLGGRAARERDERTRREAEMLPARVAVDTLVTLAAGRVALVVYDEATRTFEVRTSAR